MLFVQEISAASNEQSSGAEQISQAIQQLDTVIQQNASAAEEMAATAEELSSQADQLQQMMGTFRIRSDEKGAYAAKPVSHLAMHHPSKAMSTEQPLQIAASAAPDSLDHEFEKF